MLISDHGSSRLSGDFWLGGWLRDHGFVIERENGPEAQAAALNWLLLEQARTAGHDSGFAQRVIRRLKRLGLQSAPAGVRKRLWARLEADLPDAQAFIRWSGEVDLDRSALIPGSAYAGLLYVNPAYSGDRAALLAELRSGLMKVIDPDTGRRLFTAVHDGRSLYDAPEVAPDVVVDAYDSTWNIRTGKYTSHPGPAEAGYFYRAAAHRDFGWHSRDGVYVFAGPAFSGEQRGARAGLADTAARAGLADIAATLLHLHAVPLPEDFDGAVMRAALSEALRSRPAERQAPIEDTGDPAGEAYSAEEAEALTDHLRSLGYLD
jgi:predicted AlkP superfamily phosphohydrolase/phosphomutase